MPEEGSPEQNYEVGALHLAPRYNPDLILEHAIWPAVNHFWQGDWQEKALIGHDFTFPRSGQVEDWIFDVALHAYCSGIKQAEAPDYLLRHELSLEIEERAPESLQKVILEHARCAEPDLMRALDGYNEIVIKRGMHYGFSTEDEAEINAYQSIESASGAVIWVSSRIDETEVDINEDVEEVVFDTDIFYEEDIVQIIRGLKILGAPEDCLNAISVIKSQPIGERDE